MSRFLPKNSDPRHPSEHTRQAIDSPKGRQLYSQHIGTVEPVFGNLRHNKRLNRLNHRSQAKSQNPVAPVLHSSQHREALESGTWSSWGSMTGRQVAQLRPGCVFRCSKTSSSKLLAMKHENGTHRTSVAPGRRSGCGFGGFGQPHWARYR